MSSGSGLSDATTTNLSEIRGSCYCRAVSYAFTGKPVISAYCHCTNCQRLTNCPFVHTIHVPASSFRWTHAVPPASQTPLDLLHAYTIPAKPHKTRYRCATCGACVANYNSIRNRFSVWGAQLERTASGGGRVRIRRDVWEVVRPTAHIFYETRMLDVRDGLGKWAGYEGSSERVPETEEEEEDADESMR